MKRFLCVAVSMVFLFGAYADDTAAPIPVTEAAPAASVPATEAAPPAPMDEASVQELTTEVLQELQNYWTNEEGAMDEGEADAIELDVQQCVAMTLDTNPQVFVAESDLEAAEAKVGQARSAMLPQVTAELAFVHLDPHPSSSGGLTSLFLKVENDMRRDHIGATQVLYAGGQIRAATRASKYLAEAQEWKRQVTLNDLVFEVQKAYYDCLLARAMMRVAKDSIITFERHMADAQQMFDVGLISNFEVLRAKTELGARQSDEVAAQNAERLALVNLRRIVGLPQDKPIRLSHSLLCPPMDLSVEELVAKAAESRPELLALDKAVEAAGQNVRRTRGEFLPKAAANADWTNTDNGGMMSQDGFTFTVGAQLDIFAGGKRKYDVAEARAQLKSIEQQREDVKRMVELDVRAARIQLENAISQIRSERGTVELGREGRRLAELRFQEGVGTQAETLDADLALTGAESKLVLALHDYAVAHASIRRAIGEGAPACQTAPAAPGN